QPLNAKVEAPNYNFNLDTLNDFFPGKPIGPVIAKFGKAEPMGKQSGVETLKFQVSQRNYKFTVITQVKDGVIEDFLARLPSYFLHDTFFQAIVNRHGKQNTYKKTGEEAFYVWNKDPLKHVYSAGCTITCFPIFYSVFKTDTERNSLLQKMKKANN